MTKCQAVYPVVMLALLSLLSACAPMPQKSGAPIHDATPSVTGKPPPAAKPPSVQQHPPPQGSAIVPSENTLKPAQKAVKSLVDEAWDHYQNNEPSRAIAVAERAQRLDARSADVYLVLATSYLALGKQQVAEQFARRGISYSAVGSTVRSQLQQLIEQLSSPLISP